MNPSTTSPAAWPADVRTLAIDVGGSGLKATILGPDAAMLSERIRVDTPYPCPPERLVDELEVLVDPLMALRPHRVSVGFPGLVRAGRVIEVPSLSRLEYGKGAPDPSLASRWSGFDLRAALADRIGLQTLVENDADMQGCAVVEGHGLEFVMTLGTGVGTALFNDGRLLPHLELSHGPFEDGLTFDIALGNSERKDIGVKVWRGRVRRAVAAFHEMLWFDRLYIGGGNAKRLEPDDAGSKGVIVENAAGLLGGVRIWELADR